MSSDLEPATGGQGLPGDFWTTTASIPSEVINGRVARPEADGLIDSMISVAMDLLGDRGVVLVTQSDVSTSGVTPYPNHDERAANWYKTSYDDRDGGWKIDPEQMERIRPALKLQYCTDTVLRFDVHRGELLQRVGTHTYVRAEPPEWPEGLSAEDIRLCREILKETVIRQAKSNARARSLGPDYDSYRVDPEARALEMALSKFMPPKVEDGIVDEWKVHGTTVLQVSGRTGSARPKLKLGRSRSGGRTQLTTREKQERGEFAELFPQFVEALREREQTLIAKFRDVLRQSPVRKQQKWLGTGTDQSLAVEPEHHARVASELEREAPNARFSAGLTEDAVGAVRELIRYRKAVEGLAIEEAEILTNTLTSAIAGGLLQDHTPIANTSYAVERIEGSGRNLLRRSRATQNAKLVREGWRPVPNGERAHEILTHAGDFARFFREQIAHDAASAHNVVSTAARRGITGPMTLG